MKHLTKPQISEFREILTRRETALAKQVAVAPIDHIVDLEAALRLAEMECAQQELAAVQAALGRLDRGSFGRCLNCGAHLPYERLLVRPEAQLCEVCQSREPR